MLSKRRFDQSLFSLVIIISLSNRVGSKVGNQTCTPEDFFCRTRVRYLLNPSMGVADKHKTRREGIFATESSLRTRPNYATRLQHHEISTKYYNLFPFPLPYTQAGGGFFAYKRFQAGADAAFSQGLADEEGFGTATAEDGGAGYQVCSRGILDNIPMLPMYYKLQLSFPGWLHRRRDGRLRGGALLRGRADGR